MHKGKWMCFILCIFLVFVLLGCENMAGGNSVTKADATMPRVTGGSAPATSLEGEGGNEKVFSSSGFQITLPDDFEEISTPERVTSFYDGYSAIFVDKEPFTVHPSLETYSLKEYGEKLLQSHNMNATLQEIDGLLCFEYEIDTGDGAVKYNYFVILFKAKTDFWIVEFVSDSREALLHREKFVQWAKTVTFPD